MAINKLIRGWADNDVQALRDAVVKAAVAYEAAESEARRWMATPVLSHSAQALDAAREASHKARAVGAAVRALLAHTEGR